MNIDPTRMFIYPKKKVYFLIMLGVQPPTSPEKPGWGTGFIADNTTRPQIVMGYMIAAYSYYMDQVI